MLSALGIKLTILAATVIIGALLVLIIVVKNKLTKSVIKKLIKNRKELENAHHALVVESKVRKKEDIPFAEFIKNLDSFKAEDAVSTATVDVFDKQNNKIGRIKITGEGNRRNVKEGMKIRV